MRAVKKFAIITALVLVALVGAWTYACCANVPWVSDMARGATHNVALSMGLHVFEPANTAAGEPKKETVANLPAGYYIFAGDRPAHSAPKWVVVNADASIQWLNVDPSENRPTSAASGATPLGGTPTNGAWEDYKYPTIKWKAKPLAKIQGGAAQLLTKYEATPEGKPGVVRYLLTVMKDSSKRPRVVQLLDENGLKIQDFTVTDWLDVAGSDDFVQARDSFAMSEEDYRRVRDYTVN
jgi:hypothetical protein